jgi:hypothetical protein
VRDVRDTAGVADATWDPVAGCDNGSAVTLQPSGLTSLGGGGARAGFSPRKETGVSLEALRRTGDTGRPRLPGQLATRLVNRTRGPGAGPASR